MNKKCKITVITEYHGDNEFKEYWLKLMGKGLSPSLIRKLKETGYCELKDEDKNVVAVTQYKIEYINE